MNIYEIGTKTQDNTSIEKFDKKILIKLDDDDVKIIRKIIFGENKEEKL